MTDHALTTISADIKAAWADARAHQVAALEGYLRVGHLLDEARRQLPRNADFGTWFNAQGFGFTRQWAVRLRKLARNEAEVRRLSATAVSDGLNAPGVNRLLELLAGRSTPASATAVANGIEAIIEDLLAEGVPAVITVPATIEEAAIRLKELDDKDRRTRAAMAYLEVLIGDDEEAP